MIYIIRHGETALNAAAVVQPADTPLSERGKRQAQLLADRLAELEVTHVVASDLLRAAMTAEPIVRATYASIEHTPLLQERNFGDIRGTPYAELTQDIFARSYEPPNGENGEVFDRRVREAWAIVVEASRRLDGNLAVVTHGLVCRSLIQQSLDLPPGMPPPELFANSSLTIVQQAAPHRVELINCVAHLDQATANEGPVSSAV